MNARRRALVPVLVTVALVLAGLAAGSPASAGPPASGGSGAAVTGRVTAATGAWGAVSGPSTGATVGSSYVITWNLPSVPTQYFAVFNTGAMDLTGQSYTVANQKSVNGGNAPPDVVLDACVGATWDGTAGTCAGSVLRLAKSGDTNAAVAVALATGQRLSVRARPTSQLNFPLAYTTTIAVSVDRSQVRAARTTTS